MPLLPGLDDFPYIAQEEDSLACVPACVEMVCLYVGIERDRDQIDGELGYTIDRGTNTDRVGFLSGMLVSHLESVDEAAIHLERGLPVIAHLQIVDPTVLGYYSSDPFLHAVTVVGVESATVVHFDPDSLTQLSTSHPRTCARGDFERAWLEGWVLEPLP
jgi:hypothetical protein